MSLAHSMARRDKAEAEQILALRESLKYAERLMASGPERVMTAAHEALKLANEGLGHERRVSMRSGAVWLVGQDGWQHLRLVSREPSTVLGQSGS